MLTRSPVPTLDCRSRARVPSKKRGALRRDGGGVSALFDAVLFFVILLAASASLHISASMATSGGSGGPASERGAILAGEIQACALSCTLGPINWSGGDSGGTFKGSVSSALRELLVCNGSESGASELKSAIREVYSLLTPEPYEFALEAGSGSGAIIFVSSSASSAAGVPNPRWASTVPFYTDSWNGHVTLYIWRCGE
ncbi:MAG: hypothetical protein ACUVV6_02910 [Thermoplasmatota archaeon]